MPRGIYKRIKPSGMSGKKHSEETKRKISKAKKGKIAWNKGIKGVMKPNQTSFKKGLIPWNKNRKIKTNTGRTHFKKGMISWNKGKKYPQFTGENNSNWKGGTKEADKRWNNNHREKRRFYNKQRRIRRIYSIGSHTFGEWELLKKQYGYTCPACGRKETEIVLTEDHIIPLIKGGSNYIENIQPLCQSCNSKKHTKIIKFNIKLCQESP